MNKEHKIALVGSKKNALIFKLGEYQGKKIFDIRKYYYKTGERTPIPTKKGITLSSKTYKIVSNILKNNDKKIIDWLDGGSSKTENEVKETHENQCKIREKLPYQNRKYRKADEFWKDQIFFDVKPEGGSDTLIYNSSHPFFIELKKLLIRISQDTSSDKNITTEMANYLFDVLFLSFSRAKLLFEDSPVSNPDTLFDTLLFNWGAILSEYFNIKDKDDLETPK